VNTTPSYAPALVAFVPLDANQVGWVPLGPGDTYAPRYYDDNWQPHYLTRTQVVPAQFVNFGVPGAVTVVPVDAWGRPIDPRSVRRIDQQRLASVRSTLDPLTLTPLRNAVIHSAWGRGKMDLPPGIARKLNDTRVLVGSDVQESKFRKDQAKWMHVERVSDTARNQKFKVRDERQQSADIGRKPEVDQGRKQDLGRVTAEAKKDNKDAQQQTRQLEQQQKKDARVAERAQAQTQGQTRQAEQQQTRRARDAERAQAQVQGKFPRQAQQQQTRQARVAERAQVQAQRKSQPKIEQRPQAQRVAQPVKPARPEAKPASQAAPKQERAAPKQERKEKPPTQPAGPGHGGGGKGKKP
jgi:hypothetical protein